MRNQFKKNTAIQLLFVHNLNQRPLYLPEVASPFQGTLNLVACHVASVYLCLFLAVYQREKFAYLTILTQCKEAI